MGHRRVKTDKGTVRKPTTKENLEIIHKFIVDAGHQAGEYGGCERVRGPYPETWTDNDFPCTCGYEAAFDAFSEVLEALPDDLLMGDK